MLRPKRQMAGTPVSEATFEALLQRTREGLIVRDAQGCVTYVNPAAQNLLERSASELLGSRLTDLGLEWLFEDGARVLRSIPCLAGSNLELGCECESTFGLRRENGLVRWLRLVVHPFGDDGETQTMMLLSDVTSDRLRHAEALSLKRQLELDLEARTAELQRTLGETKELATAIARDLRVPLTQVEGHLTILREQLQDTPEAQLSMSRVQELVRDLRDFASTTHDLALMRGDGQRHTISLGLLSQSAVKDFLLGRDVSIDLDVAGPCKVGCDAGAIRGAITTLLSLASACQRIGGTIAMKCADNGYSTTLRVRVQSDPTLVTRVLTSSLADPGAKLHDEVAGVRILLVRKAAHLHEGAFWYETSGDSTDFYLTLPNAEVAVAA